MRRPRCVWFLTLAMPVTLAVAGDPPPELLCRVHEQPDQTLTLTCPASTPPAQVGRPFVDVPWSEWMALDQSQQARFRIQNGTLAIDPTVPAQTSHDPAGFKRWLAQTFTPARLNALARLYPEFVTYLEARNYAGLQWCIQAAHTAAEITADEYVAFQTAWDTYHFPMEYRP